MSEFILKLILSSPPIMGRTMPTADAILSGARIRQSGISAALDIPLERHASGFFMGSAPFFHADGNSPVIEGLSGFVKCTSLKREDFSGVVVKPFGKKGKLYGKELFRPRMDPRKTITRRFVDGETEMSLVFYCRGDEKEVRHLVEWIPGYGPRAPRGAGEIKGVHVEPFDVGDMPWRHDGHPSRPVPFDAWIALGGSEDVATDLVTCAPSYRYGEKVHCAIPQSSFAVICEERGGHE